MKVVTRSPRGFTLIETVVAMAISAILLLALGSTIMLASRAVPRGDEAVISEGELQRAFALMESDIQECTDIMMTSSLTIAVPDRDGDGLEEVIEYAYNGADKMVTRSRNGGTAETLFGPVKGLTVKQTTSNGRVDRISLAFTLSGYAVADRQLDVVLLNQPEAR